MPRGALQSETCRVCSLRYDRFHPKALGYSEAYEIAFRESERRAAEGDYSYPASRRHVLGLMRLAKLDHWKEHLRQCEEGESLERELADVPF